MKTGAFLLGLLLLAGCTTPAGNQPALHNNIDWIKDIEVAKDIAQSEDKPILIDFYTEWCGWCKRLDKDTYADPKVQEVLKQFVCVKIDAEKHRDLSKKYRISGFPSTAFLRSDAELIEVVPGYKPPEAFLDLLDSMLEKAK